MLKTPERRPWCRSGVFSDNFEHIPQLLLVCPLLTWRILYLFSGFRRAQQHNIQIAVEWQNTPWNKGEYWRKTSRHFKLHNWILFLSRYAVDLVVCAALGADMFDCVYPTRTAVSLAIKSWCKSFFHVFYRIYANVRKNFGVRNINYLMYA